MNHCFFITWPKNFDLFEIYIKRLLLHIPLCQAHSGAPFHTFSRSNINPLATPTPKTRLASAANAYRCNQRDASSPRLLSCEYFTKGVDWTAIQSISQPTTLYKYLRLWYPTHAVVSISFIPLLIRNNYHCSSWAAQKNHKEMISPGSRL